MTYYFPITSTNSGIVLSTAGQNPSRAAGGVSVTNTTANHGGDAIYGYASYAWTIHNYGTVKSNPSAGSGIDLAGGGAVTNNGTIDAYRYGVFIGADPGLVVNSGTIIGGRGFEGAAIFMEGISGSISNSGLMVGEVFMVGGTVSNTGTIAGYPGLNSGLVLDTGGGVVTNSAATAAIQGYATGISIRNTAVGAATLVNDGTIASTGLQSRAVDLYLGGFVSNASSGFISGGSGVSGAGIRIQGAVGTVVNAGTVTTGHQAVWLEAGGIVSNSPSGVIDGAGDGVHIDGATGTVANLGSIIGEGNVYSGVALLAGGYVGNGTAGSNALIQGVDHGVFIAVAAGYVTNYATIRATGYIGHGVGVYLNVGGSVTNSGAITGDREGVRVNNFAGTVRNIGTITGTSQAGVRLGAGGLVINNAGRAAT
ncbi:MAG: hypothetical protein ACM3JG_05440, partial [Thiohalocapsa sp.]